MIVAKGLGRRVTGASGIIAAAGLGLVLIQGAGGGIPPVQGLPLVRVPSAALRILDDADLLDIIPIVIEVINYGS